MKKWIAVGILVVCFPITSIADISDCQEAIDQFNSATDDISSTLKAYTECVSSSQGHDDCSLEFTQLSSAQGDFEDAVANYQADCEQ